MCSNTMHYYLVCSSAVHYSFEFKIIALQFGAPVLVHQCDVFQCSVPPQLCTLWIGQEVLGSHTLGHVMHFTTLSHCIYL